MMQRRAIQDAKVLEDSAEVLNFADRRDFSRVEPHWCFVKLSVIVMGLSVSIALSRPTEGIAPGALTLAISIVAAVWTQHAIAEETHDGIHYRLLPGHRSNDILSRVYSSLIGTSFDVLRADHLRHHQYLGSPQDPDYPKYAVIPATLFGWARYFAMNFIGFVAVSRTLGFPRPSVTARQSDPLRMLGIAAAQLALLVLSLAFNPFWYVCCWLIPLMSITFGITQFRTLLEHWPGFGTGAPGAALVDLEGPIAAQFLAAQFGYRFHATHHQAPTVPNYRLKALRAERISNGEHVPPRQTYLARIRNLSVDQPRS